MVVAVPEKCIFKVRLIERLEQKYVIISGHPLRWTTFEISLLFRRHKNTAFSISIMPFNDTFLALAQACFSCTFWRPSRPNRASYTPLSVLPKSERFLYNSLSFWRSFLIFFCKTVRKQVALVGKLQICHFLQQIITRRLKFNTLRFWIRPHNKPALVA